MSKQPHVVPLSFTERPSLELRATAEQIFVMPVEPGGSPRIELDHRRGENSGLVVENHGDTVMVKAELGEAAASWLFGAVPFRRLTLYVPQQLRARIRQDFGSLHVERLAGCDLELSASAGTITLDQLRGRLKVAVDSGTINGQHLAGTFDVRTAAGAVKLGIDALDAGEHRIRTELGSVKVHLAAGQRVKFESHTALGSSRVSYPSSSDAEATMLLSAELGSIRVKAGDEFEDPRHGDWPDWRRFWSDAVDEVNAAVSDAMPKPKPQPVPEAELRKVLELVQDGKLTATDAERLIRAMGR